MAAKAPHEANWFQPHVRILNPEHHSQEKEPTRHVAVKISGDSVCLGEKGVC